MADIRELIILSPRALDPAPESPFFSILADIRMAVRRAVVRSARIPSIHRLYSAIYDAHLRLAAHLGKRFSGTRAVYLTSGLSSGDINIGISDIDIAIYGDWPDEQQFRLMKLFGVLTVLSPLFDRRSLGTMSTVEDLKALCASDMFMALNHARGCVQWKLLYGSPVLNELPEISPERFAGCVYMDLRRWWSILAGLAFGNDITTRDTIFRNSICFKATADMLRVERMLLHGIDTTRRVALIEQELARSEDPNLRMLLNSVAKQYLEIESDPRTPTLHWFLNRAERFHEQVRSTPSFATTIPVTILGDANERTIAAQTASHAQQLITLARTEWPGLRSASLVPAVAMLFPDSLALILEVDPRRLPAFEQLHRLGAAHMKASPNLPQRLAVYLQLPNAAYLLDASSSLEFFHYTLLPEANPDVFHALSQPGYTLFGNPQPAPTHIGWSPFARELMLEELQARRGAYKRFGLVSRPSPMENLRNLWRFLQLVIIERSQNIHDVTLPITIPAIRRAFAALHPDRDADLQTVEQLHRLALDGTRQDASEIEAAIQRFSAFTKTSSNHATL